MVVVVGLCVIASVAVCFMSYAFVHNYNIVKAAENIPAAEEKTEGISEDKSEPPAENKPEGKHTSLAAIFRETFSSLSWGQWITMAIVAILAIVCCLRIKKLNVDWINGIKVMISFMALSGASLIDAKIRKIPNKLCAIMLALRAVLFLPEWLLHKESFFASLIGSIVGFFVCLAALWLFSILSKGGLGMGDVKLVSSLGFMMGLASALLSMFLGMVVCTIVAIMMIVMRRKTMKDHVPFAPFIFVGFVLYIICCKF